MIKVFYRTIYSMKVMLALAQRGFIPVATFPNPKEPKFNAWNYEVTDEFTEALDKILGELAREKR